MLKSLTRSRDPSGNPAVRVGIVMARGIETESPTREKSINR